MPRQVVTELDFLTAMCDYIAEQLNGRFRLEFPDSREIIDHIVESFTSPWLRENVEIMQRVITTTTCQIGGTMTACVLTGCANETNHRFMREFLDLMWDAREFTGDWLRGQGIVPGQSVN